MKYNRLYFGQRLPWIGIPRSMAPSGKRSHMITIVWSGWQKATRCITVYKSLWRWQIHIRNSTIGQKMPDRLAGIRVTRGTKLIWSINVYTSGKGLPELGFRQVWDCLVRWQIHIRNSTIGHIIPDRLIGTKVYKRDKTNMKCQCLYIWQKLARIRIPTSMGLSGKMTNRYQKSNHRSQDARQIDWDKVCKRDRKPPGVPLFIRLVA